jgi:nitrate/nitrite-specific signal transduction histidine kinase
MLSEQEAIKVMSCNVEVSANALPPRISRAGDLVARAAGRIEEWFRRADPQASLNHDLSLVSIEQALCLVREELILYPNARFRIFVKGRPAPIEPAIQQQLHLIGREALVNAFRHSRATSIEGEVEYLRRRLHVMISDNGCGIDPEMLRSKRPQHSGLLRMRERAAAIGAQLRIWSGPGAGTEVEISVPCPNS